MECNQTKEEQIRAMLSDCEDLGADIRPRLERGYFTATAWIVPDDPAAWQKAEIVQNRIKALSMQYPNVVCYGADADSTLVYAI